MDFHEAISIDNSEPDNYLKHSFFSTVVILYILRIFLSLTGCRFAKPSKEEKHASTRFTDLQASCVTQCSNILMPLFWLTNKKKCINKKT